MYCSSNGQVKSSILLGQRRRPVCLMLKVDILGRQDHRESLSTVDGALRCCGSAGTVQTSMVVPGRVDTCWPWCRVWTWHAQGRPANVGRYDECLSANGQTCGCQIRMKLLLCYISAVVANVLANLLSWYFLLVDTRVKTMVTNWIFNTLSVLSAITMQ